MPYPQGVELVTANADLNRADKSGESLLELADFRLNAFVLLVKICPPVVPFCLLLGEANMAFERLHTVRDQLF